MFNINKKFHVAPTQDIILTLYSDSNDTYLCWDSYDKYYYWGQTKDDNVICWHSTEEFNKFYAMAIKCLSVMKIPNINPRCAILYKNK